MKSGQKQQLREASQALVKYRVLEGPEDPNIIGLEYNYYPHKVTVIAKAIPHTKKIILICPTSVIGMLLAANPETDISFLREAAKAYGISMTAERDFFEDSDKPLLSRLTAMISFILGVFGIAELYNAAIKRMKQDVQEG